VTPIAECVDVLPGGQLLAHFGYRNDGPFDVIIPLAENFFAPAPSNRGQPTTFSKGRVVNSFTVAFPASESLTWRVAQLTATASLATARCEGNQIVNCTENADNGNLSALDNLAVRQRAQVYNIAQQIEAFAKRNPAVQVRAKRLMAQARQLYLQQWTGIWSNFKQVTLVCVGVGCSSVDRAEAIASIQDRSLRFLRLARQAGDLLKSTSRGSASKKADSLVSKTRKIHQEVLERTADLPRFESQCG
jgi:hypothetical protein